MFVHCFLDGRDTPPTGGKGYVEQLTAKMEELGVGQVALLLVATTPWIVITVGIV